MGFVTSRDVDTFAEKFAVSNCSSAAIDHEGGSIVAGHRHDAAWHILVAARYRDASIMLLSTGDGLDAISDDLSTLEGEPHA